MADMGQLEGAEAPKKVIEFQPDALSIANKPLPGIIRFGVWFPLVIVTLAIVWACIAKTDMVVQGGGKLVTNKSTIIMKPLERVVIKTVDVKIGDVVEKGQKLITFDAEIYEAEANRLRNEIVALEAQLARLEAEFNGTPFVQRSNDRYWKDQMAMYRQREQYYRERITYFDKTISQLGVSKKSRQASLEKKAILLAKQRDIEKRYLAMKEGAVPVVDMLQVQMQVVNIEDAYDQLENDIRELDEKRGSLMAEKNAFVQDWNNRISEDMVNVDRNLTSTRRQYDKQDQMLKYVELLSPCKAVVQQIAEFAPGSGVREAEALITLIPLDGDIELEAEIRPEDIGKIKVGDEARIKLTAYQFQKYGTLEGKVRDISQDTLDRQVGGGTLKYYRVRVTVGGRLRLTPEERKTFRLIPGMESQCEIKCGSRRVIEYVLYPLIKAMDETAREP